MENPLLTEEQATDTLREISTHIQSEAIGDAFHLDAGVFLGVNQDNNDFRFANALNFLIKKKVNQNYSNKVFLLCIDPNFTTENIQRTINGITEVYGRSPENIRLVSSHRIPWSGSSMFSVSEEAAEANGTANRVNNRSSNGLAANRPNNTRANEPNPFASNSSIFASAEGTNILNNIYRTYLLNTVENRPVDVTPTSLPPLYKITVTYRNPRDGAERTFAIPVYFMRYALRSNYAASIFASSRSLLNIQLGRKTFQNYADECTFQDREDPIANFYKALYSFVSSDSIQYLYFFSTVHTHTQSMPFRNSSRRTNAGEEDWWMHGYTLSTHPDRLFRADTVDNRYLQTLCEIHSLLKILIEEGRDVFFINLDKLEVFQRPAEYNGSAGLHNEYSNVRLGRSTEFYRNSQRNLRFHRIVNSSYPPRLLRNASGGKAKTKKRLRKSKTTRKHRV